MAVNKRDTLSPSQSSNADQVNWSPGGAIRGGGGRAASPAGQCTSPAGSEPHTPGARAASVRDGQLSVARPKPEFGQQNPKRTPPTRKAGSRLELSGGQGEGRMNSRDVDVHHRGFQRRRRWAQISAKGAAKGVRPVQEPPLRGIGPAERRRKADDHTLAASAGGEETVSSGRTGLPTVCQAPQRGSGRRGEDTGTCGRTNHAGHGRPKALEPNARPRKRLRARENNPCDAWKKKGKGK